MEFTINGYVNLLELLRKREYNFCLYDEIDSNRKNVIIRHDIDFSLDKALEIAKIENKHGVKSTYFILLATDFYNVFSKQSFEKLYQIQGLGHEIGLHFDETRYDITTVEEMKQYVEKEAAILANLLNTNVKVVSMHRPSKFTLKNDIQFDELINSYSTKYFKEMKYVSDSRMHWREDPIEAIESNSFENLHILTHPFWYSDENETMKDKLKKFMNNAVSERFDFINDNFRDLEQVISRKEIVG